MNYFVLKTERLNDFIIFLKTFGKIVAPVKKGEVSYAFEDVSSADEISLNYVPTILPPKKYLLPQHEVLAEYDKNNGQTVTPVVELEDLVLFGVHTCDLAGIHALNVVFNDRPKDLNYLIRKKHLTIIGLECNNYCDDNATCAMMGNHNPMGGYDLLFSIIDDGFMVHVNTQKGDQIVEKSALFNKPTSEHMKAYERVKDKKIVHIWKPGS